MKKNIYNDIKHGKRRLIKVFDIIFIVCLIAVIALAYGLTTQNKSGSYAEIYSDGHLVKVMPLNTDGQYKCVYGDGDYNIIKVESGKISVTEASCNDEICMHYPPTDIAGSIIVCLPHKLFIVIKGDNGFDGVAG